MNDEIVKEVLLTTKKIMETFKTTTLSMLLTLIFVCMCFAGTIVYIVGQAYDYDTPIISNNNNNTNGGIK